MAQRRFTFLNNWGLNLNVSYSPEGQSDTQTRGGPLMMDPAELNFRLDANSDREPGVPRVRPASPTESRDADADTT